MPISVSVRLPRGQQEQLLELTDPKRYRWAEKEALNRASANVQQFAVKKVAKEMGVSKSRIRKRGRRAKASLTSRSFGSVTKGRRASIRRLFTSITGYGRPFNVTRFNAHPVYGERTKGATNFGQIAVTHKAYDRSQTVERTWMMLNTPGRPVVKRVGGKTKTGRAKIKGVFGPGIAWVMEQPHVLLQIERFAIRRFRHHWRSRLKFAFESRGMPRG